LVLAGKAAMTGAVAIIPARGGSKRIPRKNIKPFLGRPMLAWPIAEALRSGLFDEVVVSTDDDEIAEVARQAGAYVPFTRPAELADDHATTLVVMQHAIRALAEQGTQYEAACCIYPTAPFLQARFLAQAKQQLLQQPDRSFALGVTSFPFPIQRAVRVTADGGLDAFYPEFRNTRSQDLEPAFHDAGQFCWGRAKAWLDGTPVFSPATLPVVLPRYLVQDIDTPEDWQRAELLFRLVQDDATGDACAS
jgi:N-acylneuraminate cytidylyltransferase